MKIGNWDITENTIEFIGKDFQRFIINRQSLLATVPSEDSGENLYKWIVMATETEWLSHDDLYDLNFAFVYAAGADLLGFDYALFDRTMEYQFDILDEEEEEEEEEES